MNALTANLTRPWVRSAVAAVALAAMTAPVLGHLPASADDRAAPPGAGWQQVNGPPIVGANSLNAVAAFGPGDAWAVGSQGVVGTDEERPFVARWDGSAWSLAPVPGRTQLTGVAGTGSDDVWAVGSRAADSSVSTILHRDARAWREVPHVAATPDDPLTLNGVAALARDDAWAVGSRGSFPSDTAHAQRWDGTAWHEVDVPVPAGADSTVLTSVSGTSSSNVWAAGFGFNLGEGRVVPYFVHWNGTQWRLVDAPSSVVGAYNDVQALGNGGFIAVGSNASEPDFIPTPVAVTYDGQQWRQEALPAGNGELDAVTPNGSGGFWAVGTGLDEGQDHDGRPLILLRTAQGEWLESVHQVTSLGSLRDVQWDPRSGRTWAVGRTGDTDETVRNLVLGHS